MVAGDLSQIDWNDFPMFLAAVRLGSFRRAAVHLQTSQQRVSMRVAALEQQLGFKLLARVPHGVELTPEGRRVLSFVQAAEGMLARTKSVVCGPRDAIEGECHLALGDGMGMYWFARYLGAFASAHPRIALYPHVTTERPAAKSPGHDIQVLCDTPDETLVATRVATLHFMLFASREYLDNHGMPASRGDLIEHRLVDFTLADSERGTFASLHGLSERALVITNSFGTQCEAVRWGAGIGLLPSYACLVHANLVPILPDLRMQAPVFACFEREVGKRPAVRATLDFLKDTVFNRTRMPWFADEFVTPEPHWAVIAG